MNKFLGKMRNRKGFTLIELIVVMAIIGILVLLAAPRYLNYTKDAHVTSMQADAKVLENLVLAYSATNEGELPVVMDDSGTPEDTADDFAVEKTLDPEVEKAIEATLGVAEAPAVYELSKTILDSQIQGLKNDITQYGVTADGDIFHLTKVLENSTNKFFVSIDEAVGYTPAP